MDSLLIARNTTALLQSLLDRVNFGYTFWTSGTIKSEKAEGLCQKFHERYGVLAPRQRRDYNHKLKRANSYLLMYPQVGGDILDWILIATPGKGVVHELEKLHDSTSGQHTDRLKWRHYELVTLNHRMTWRLRRDVREEWEKRIVSAARKAGLTDLEATIKMLRNFPMFTGVREQVFALIQKAYRTRQRHHHSTQIALSRLPIMRRIKVYDAPPKTLGLIVDVYQAKVKFAAWSSMQGFGYSLAG